MVGSELSALSFEDEELVLAAAVPAHGSDGDGTRSADSDARIETELAADGTTIVVAVDGELTMLSSPGFRATLVAATQRSGGAVVVDLTGCTFIDSTGLNALAHAKELLNGGTARVSLVVAHPHLLRLIELTHLDHVLAVYGDRAAAMNGNSSSLRIGRNDSKLDPHAGRHDNGRGDTDVTS